MQGEWGQPPRTRRNAVDSDTALLRGLTSSWYYLVSNDPLFQRGCELHRGRAVQPVHRDGGHHQVQQDRERRR